MAIRSGFFNSVNGDRRYLADNFAEYFASFIGNGVFANPSNTFQVYEKENMIVNVKAGKAWINGYIAVNDGDYNLTITNADGVLNRIDRIVLRLDFNVRAINIAVKKGAFASTPVAPTLQRDAEVYELVLADVYVGKGITRITQSNITDQRMNKDLCGVVKGTVDQIDTTDLFNQYGSAFQEWFETVKNYLNDTAVGNVANKLAEHELSKGAHGLGIAELNTTAKTIREAINEVFQNANNGKTLVANAIVGKEGVANENMTFAQLATAISNIQTVGFATGEVSVKTPTVNTQSLSISLGLTKKPKAMVFLFKELNTNVILRDAAIFYDVENSIGFDKANLIALSTNTSIQIYVKNFVYNGITNFYLSLSPYRQDFPVVVKWLAIF